MANPNSLQRYPQYAVKMQNMQTYSNGPLVIYGLTPKEANTIRTQFYGYRQCFAKQKTSDPEIMQQILFAESLTVRIRDIQPEEIKLCRAEKRRPENCKVLVCAPYNMLVGELDSVVDSAIEDLVAGASQPKQEVEVPSGVDKFMLRFGTQVEEEGDKRG